MGLCRGIKGLSIDSPVPSHNSTYDIAYVVATSAALLNWATNSFTIPDGPKKKPTFISYYPI